MGAMGDVQELCTNVEADEGLIQLIGDQGNHLGKKGEPGP